MSRPDLLPPLPAAGLLTIKEVLEAPLPRAYTETVMGCEPVDPQEHLVGGGGPGEGAPRQ